MTHDNDLPETVAKEITRTEVLRADSMHHSSSMENLLEHVFIAEILQECWFRRMQRVEVLRAEVDAHGYDVVLECGSVIRHVQLKGSSTTGRTARQTINARLAEKASGCVVWIRYEEDPTTHRLNLSYLWFGGHPKKKLPPLGKTRGTNTRSGTVREGTRVLARARFSPIGVRTSIAGDEAVHQVLIDRSTGCFRHRM